MPGSSSTPTTRCQRESLPAAACTVPRRSPPTRPGCSSPSAGWTGRRHGLRLVDAMETGRSAWQSLPGVGCRCSCGLTGVIGQVTKLEQYVRFEWKSDSGAHVTSNAARQNGGQGRRSSPSCAGGAANAMNGAAHPVLRPAAPARPLQRLARPAAAYPLAEPRRQLFTPRWRAGWAWPRRRHQRRALCTVSLECESQSKPHRWRLCFASGESGAALRRIHWEGAPAGSNLLRATLD